MTIGGKEGILLGNRPGVLGREYITAQDIPHWHEACELLYVHRGNAVVFCNGSEYELTAGNGFYFDSNQAHFIRARSADADMCLLAFDAALVKSYLGDRTLVSPVLEEEYDLHAITEEVRKTLSGESAYAVYEAACHITLKLLEIFRASPTVQKEELPYPMDRFEPLLREINEKYEFITLNTAAKFMKMNPAYFSRLFHARMGITFSQYLNYVKVRAAVRFIQRGEGLSATEISYRCGFSTIRSFNRTFRAVTGYSPTTLPQKYRLREQYLHVENTPHEHPMVEYVRLRADGTTEPLREPVHAPEQSSALSAE